MNKLMLVVVLVAACGSSNTSNSTPDAPPQQVDAAAGPPCFSGTPTTHDQLVNACVDSSVTVIHKAPVLPLLNSDGSLPQLP